MGPPLNCSEYSKEEIIIILKNTFFENYIKIEDNIQAFFKITLSMNSFKQFFLSILQSLKSLFDHLLNWNHKYETLLKYQLNVLEY